MMRILTVTSMATMCACALIGCGSGPVSRPSDVIKDIPIDWTQPSSDVLDYYVGYNGQMALPSSSHNGALGVASFLVDGGERITMCGGGSCEPGGESIGAARATARAWSDGARPYALSNRGTGAHSDFRVDSDFVWLVQDNYLYNSEWGRALGTRWARRDWMFQVGRYLWAYCGDHGDCDPCPEDDMECRQLNGYALLCPLQPGVAGATPIRLRTTIVNEGVVDWHGTVGRRHTIMVVYQTIRPDGRWVEERAYMGHGAGMLYWEDPSGATPGWGPRQPAYDMVDARSVGYRPEDSHRIGW